MSTLTDRVFVDKLLLMSKVNKSGRVSIRIKPTLRAKINEIIKEQKWSITTLVEEALIKYLKK